MYFLVSLSDNRDLFSEKMRSSLGKIIENDQIEERMASLLADLVFKNPPSSFKILSVLLKAFILFRLILRRLGFY
jgi:hypothetical protein